MSSTRWWAVFAGIAAFELVLLIKLSISGATVPLLITIGLIAILLLLILRIEELDSLIISRTKLEAKLTQQVENRVNQVGDEIKDNVKDVEKRQEKTEKRQEELQEIIDALSVALEGITTKYERDHLEKLRPNAGDMVKFGPNFFEEIERLDSIGFIEPIKRDGIIAMKNEHGNNGEKLYLREYVKLTNKGKNYLNIVGRFRNGLEAMH